MVWNGWVRNSFSGNGDVLLRCDTCDHKVGPYQVHNSVCGGYSPSNPFIRPFIGAPELHSQLVGVAHFAGFAWFFWEIELTLTKIHRQVAEKSAEQLQEYPPWNPVIYLGTRTFPNDHRGKRSLPKYFFQLIWLYQAEEGG